MVTEALSKALTGVDVANFEFSLSTRLGNRVEILLDVSPRKDLSGNIVGVVGIGQDITRRIAQEHEYFRLVDTASAVFLGIDRFGLVNKWNLKIEEVTGRPISTILGESLVDSLVAPASQSRVRTVLEEALTGANVDDVDLPITTPDNNVVILVVGLSSTKDVQGNVVGAIAVGQVQRV